MKHTHNSNKQLKELYHYLDDDYDMILENPNSTEEECIKALEKNNFYEKRFKDCYRSKHTCREYYGVFKLKKGYGIDSKRFNQIIPLNPDILKRMNKRNTTYFHPLKEHHDDYFVNMFVDCINGIINEFNDTYKPLIERELKEIKAKEAVKPGDSSSLHIGKISAQGAEVWANLTNYYNNLKVKDERFLLINSLYNQFFLKMVSQIEAVTIKVYSKINSKFKNWNRGLLYDNVNAKKISSRTLKSFKYHDLMYSIWNFLKHNNLDTYEAVKKEYPEVLINKEYAPGDLAIHYLKLSEELILTLLEGTKNFFIEWCELNVQENYFEATWNYTDYFLNLVKEDIKSNDCDGCNLIEAIASECD